MKAAVHSSLLNETKQAVYV